MCRREHGDVFTEERGVWNKSTEGSRATQPTAELRNDVVRSIRPLRAHP